MDVFTRLSCAYMHYRVEAIASSSSLDVNFSSLRKSIRRLQTTSVALDKEKVQAERKLKKIMKKMVRRRLVKRKIRRAFCKVKKLFGKECAHHGSAQPDSIVNVPSFTADTGSPSRIIKPRIGRAPAWAREQREGKCHLKPHRPPKKLLKAVERVRNANKKLVAFERGFISEEGIKDREWYKHLGVAPGKWLGAFLSPSSMRFIGKLSTRLRRHYAPGPDRVIYDRKQRYACQVRGQEVEKVDRCSQQGAQGLKCSACIATLVYLCLELRYMHGTDVELCASPAPTRRKAIDPERVMPTCLALPADCRGRCISPHSVKNECIRWHWKRRCLRS